MTLRLANNAATTLASGINQTATTITVAAGTGARFPTLYSGDYFNLTIAGQDGLFEIVRVTARYNDTLTVVRAQESTSARNFVTGSLVELRITVGNLATGNTGERGPQGLEGAPGFNVYLDVKGYAATELALPASANVGDGYVVGPAHSSSVYIWANNQWNQASDFTTPEHAPVANIIYVTKDGDDLRTGRSLLTSVLTISRGLQIARDFRVDYPTTPILVSVYPGIYVENGELEIPDQCGVVSTGGQYICEVHAAVGYEETNMFLVGSGSYVQGFGFRNQRVDSFENPTKGFAVAFRPGALIRRSPYIRDISQVSNYYSETVAPPLASLANPPNPDVGRGGGTLLADRAVLDKDSIFPYMLGFAATPRSPNGLGYVAKNGAGINGISSITIFQRCAFYALNGGQITLNNSGTQFGDISMRAKGSMQVVEPHTSTVTMIENDTFAASLQTNKATIAAALWAQLVSEGYTAPWPSTFEALTIRDAQNAVQAVSNCFKVGSQQNIRSYTAGFFDYQGNYAFNAANTQLFNGFIRSFEILELLMDPYITSSPGKTMLTGLIGIVKTTLNTPQKIAFGSLIESVAHQFNLAGAGVNKNALPLNFRRTGQPLSASGSVLEEDGGRVRWSGSDELNNVFFPGGLRVNGVTGRLEGRPFTSAVRRYARRAANSRVST
jgi:hypothetical protein